MYCADEKKIYLSLMLNNPIEAILIHDLNTNSIFINNVFKKMFGLENINSIDQIIPYLCSNIIEQKLVKKRIFSCASDSSDKPIKISKNGHSFHLYVYYDAEFKLIFLHARDREEFDKVFNQLNEYAEGLVQNIFDLEISQRKLLKTKDRLNRQVKASSVLGLTNFETYKDITRVFEIFTEIASNTLEVERCGIWLLENSGTILKCKDIYISSRSKHMADMEFEESLNPIFFKAVNSMRILKAEDAVNNEHTAELAEIYIKPNSIYSILITTIVLKGKVVGVVTFENIDAFRNWEDDEVGFAVIFADHIGRMLSDLERDKLESQLIQSQKMETIGILAGGLAHDFNNLLSGIVGTLSMLKYNYKELNKKDIFDYLEIMEEASDRATNMIQQLFAITRKDELSFAPVDLNLTIKHIIKISKNTFDKSVEIKPTYYKSPAVVNADTIRLEQVLLNLCVNAYHAMTSMKDENAKQGGTLSIDMNKFHADHYFCSSHPDAVEGDYYVMSVRDNGVGIDKEIIDKIFEPFFTTKNNHNLKGTGLGLTMVYNIIYEHKGFIKVYSEVNIGSVFQIYLPVLNQNQIQAKSIDKKEFRKGTGLILVVDDEALIRQLAREMLEKCGYDVILASNGEEGVTIFKNRYKDISAVLLDMAMPKKSGKDAYFEMKQIDKNLKVLLASGYKHDSRAEEILQSGVQGFIQKPFTMLKLAEEMHRVINSEK